MPLNQFLINERISAAELALKAYVVASDAVILAQLNNGDSVVEEIADAVDLSEAPEDTVCSLVIDLMQYCERQKIDWAEDVIERAQRHLDSDQADF
ncbi:MAG TPA: hypothetical protein VGW57_15015 [Chthoniobacterales bacterium]|nr:hypothetical protein [Chthoniobacterales bacterium]